MRFGSLRLPLPRLALEENSRSRMSFLITSTYIIISWKRTFNLFQKITQVRRDQTFAIIQRLPPERTKRYYSKPTWRLQRSKIAQTRKLLFPSLLSPKSILGPKTTFWRCWAFWSLFTFCSKWLKMASREHTKHRPGAFWLKSWLVWSKVVQNGKKGGNGTISDFEPKIDFR